MEHVRVGRHDLAGAPDRRADRSRRVAVIGGCRDAQPGRHRELGELGDLVLAEGLGREEQQGAGRRVLGDRLEDRQRVAQGLARRGRRDDHDVLAGTGELDGLRLVEVGALDPAPRQAGHDARVEPARELPVLGGPGRQDGVMDDAAADRRLGQQAQPGPMPRHGERRCASVSPLKQNGCTKLRESSRRSPCGVTAWLSRAAELTPPWSVATLPRMVRRIAPPPPEDSLDDANVEGSPSAPVGGSGGPDLAALPIAGISQRRMAMLLGALVAAWIIVLFARQVGDAAAASARAEAMIADNAARHAQVAALDRELARIQQPRFVLLQARAHGLGGHNEIAFTLDPGAPPLARRRSGLGRAAGRGAGVGQPARSLADPALRLGRLTGRCTAARWRRRSWLSTGAIAIAEPVKQLGRALDIGQREGDLTARQLCSGRSWTRRIRAA